MDRIELRSEKVRNIIGDIPPALVRWGAGIIALLLAGLVTAAALIPYPETLKAEAEVIQAEGNRYTVACMIPYKLIAQIKPETEATLEFEGYDAHTYGYLKSHIIQIDRQVHRQAGKNYFRSILQLDTLQATPYPILKEMKGTATIWLSDQSILQHLFPFF